MLAQKECKRRHDKVSRVIHWDLAGKCGFERNDRRYDHACPREKRKIEFANSSMKGYTNFTSS